MFPITMSCTILNQEMPTQKCMIFRKKLIRKLCLQSFVHDSSDDEHDLSPPKVSPVDPICRLHGGFKFHHVSMLPQTEEISTENILSLQQKQYLQRHALLLQGVQGCSLQCSLLWGISFKQTI